MLVVVSGMEGTRRNYRKYLLEYKCYDKIQKLPFITYLYLLLVFFRFLYIEKTDSMGKRVIQSFKNAVNKIQ